MARITREIDGVLYQITINESSIEIVEWPAWNLLKTTESLKPEIKYELGDVSIYIKIINSNKWIFIIDDYPYSQLVYIISKPEHIVKQLLKFLKLRLTSDVIENSDLVVPQKTYP